MRSVDSVRLAWQIFRRNKLRTSLTVLGVSVGVGVIVFLVSLGYGLQQLTIERIAQADSLLTIDVSSPDPQKPINDSVAETIKGIEGVESVHKVVQLPGLVELEQEFIDLGVVWGVEPKYFDLEGLSFLVGKPFVQGVVVTKALADLLKLSPEQVIGSTIVIRVFPQKEPNPQGVALPLLSIEGVIQENLIPAVYLSREQIFDFTNGNYHSLKVKAAQESQVNQIRDALVSQGFQAQATIDDIDQLEKGFRLTRIVLGIFGLIALVISSIGMLNTMTISLLERIKEIGIMKSLGASDFDIWLLFLTEASLMGFMGGIGGLILAKIAGTIFNFLFNVISYKAGGAIIDLFNTPLQFGLGMILFAILVGIITGVYPARRAARLNPLQALRYE